MKPKAKRPMWTGTSDVIDAIGEKARLYLRFQIARIAFGNQVSAFERGGIPEVYTLGMRADLDGIIAHEDQIKREIEKSVEAHPFGEFTLARHKGLGALGLGQIWGAFGNIERYRRPSSMWKMAGLQVVDGRSPKRQRGVRWGEHDPRSFSPLAKTTMWRLADSALRGKNDYKVLYDEVRAKILARERTGPSGCPFGQEHRNFDREVNEAGENRKVNDNKKTAPCVKAVVDQETGEVKESSGHVHMHCNRIVRKRMLLDLWMDWQAWRSNDVPPVSGVCDEPEVLQKTRVPMSRRH